MAYLDVTFCPHGARLKQWPCVSYTTAINISPSLNVIKSIDNKVLAPEEVIVVDISLRTWIDLVLLSFYDQLYRECTSISSFTHTHTHTHNICTCT